MWFFTKYLRWQRFFFLAKTSNKRGIFLQKSVYHAQEAWEILLGGMAAVTHFLQNMVMLTKKFKSGWTHQNGKSILLMSFNRTS